MSNALCDAGTKAITSTLKVSVTCMDTDVRNLLFYALFIVLLLESREILCTIQQFVIRYYAIQENRTLTYLDLRSNDLTNNGLRGLSEHLRWSPVFHTVDVRGNAKISRDVVISTRRLLKSTGRSATEVRWIDYGSALETR